ERVLLPLQTSSQSCCPYQFHKLSGQLQPAPFLSSSFRQGGLPAPQCSILLLSSLSAFSDFDLRLIEHEEILLCVKSFDFKTIADGGILPAQYLPYSLVMWMPGAYDPHLAIFVVLCFLNSNHGY